MGSYIEAKGRGKRDKGDWSRDDCCRGGGGKEEYWRPSGGDVFWQTYWVIIVEGRGGVEIG